MSTDPHDNPQGPGDARPTAAQIVVRENAADRLKGKKVLITGATNGIGFETAKVLASIGCHLYLPVRNLSAASATIAEIQKYADGKAQVEVLSMDLASLASIREAVKELKKRTQTLNILINNAGVMAIPESYTVDGFETQFGTNHLGHFLLFQLVKPLLLAGSTKEFNSRVISLSSAGHAFGQVMFDDFDLKKSGYDKWKAYGQSKTANIYLATEIERRYGNKGIHAWAVHPGGILTNLGAHLSEQEIAPMLESMTKELKSVGQGAATTVWAATAAGLEGKGGRYLEDCRVAKPKTAADSFSTGHAPYAYDEGAAIRLYEASFAMVGIKDE